MLARIYSPCKNAMQSGKANRGQWVLEFYRTSPSFIEPLMGYTASKDMNKQIRMRFDTVEQAVNYAKNENIAFVVENTKQQPEPISSSYGSNFAFGRTIPWTH